MSINRDIAVLFAASQFPSSNELRFCDPMTGTGVRTVRYLLETPNVQHVVAADKETAAVELARETTILNQVEDRVSVIHSDAHTLFSEHVADRFDLIDLDPFGSPAPFFESALRATTDGGVIAATATDMGPLSGARQSACMRKYSVSVPKTEFDKELAVRALASCLSATACKVELGIEIAFAHATDHYARLYAVVSKGRKAANHTLTSIGYLTYCPTCLFRIEAKSISSIRSECVNCSGPAHIGGPFWIGPLWDRTTLESMIRRTPSLISSRLPDVQKLLEQLQGEVDLPRFYYKTDAIASTYNIKPPSLQSLIESLIASGYQAARTHFCSTGFRTNASLPVIVDCFRTIAEKS